MIITRWKRALFGACLGIQFATRIFADSPAITLQPADQEADPGGTAIFTVSASGTEPLSYRWFFNNTALVNGAGVIGATSSTLILSPVEPWMAGSYSAILSNSEGVAFSSPGILTIPSVPTLAQALDTDGTSLAWTTAGPSWFGQNNVSKDGLDSASSGIVANSGSASVQTTVVGPGSVTFWWKVSCETNNDRLRFSIDGTDQGSISGEVDWQQRTYALGSGSHTLQWRYTKNASISAGQDRAWLDQVQFNPADCSVTFSPSSRAHSAAAATGSILVNVAAGCQWGVVNTNAWITTVPVIGATNFVQYALAPNPGLDTRSGVIHIGGQEFTVTQLGNACSFTLSPSSRTHSSSAEIGIVNLATAPGCPWDIANPYAWIHILSGANGSNSAAITYSLDANLEPVDRSGTLTIGGQFFIVTQLAGGTDCSYTVSPTSFTHDAGTSTGVVSVATLAGCAWDVVTTNAWITLATGANGLGNGSVVYITMPNPNITSRTGTLRVAGQTVTIAQSGGISLAEAIDVEGAPVTLSTVGSPAWVGQSSVTHDGIDAAEIRNVAHSSAATIQAVVTGPGTISFWWKVSSELTNDYLKFFLNGVQQARISGETSWEYLSFELPAGAQTSKWTYAKNAAITAGLDRGWVDQVMFTPTGGGGCSYTLSPNARVHPSIVSTGLVTLATSSQCAWSVVNTNPWVQVLTASDGVGETLVRYRIQENLNPASRAATILIGGQAFAISQLGSGCSFSLAATSANFDASGGAGTVSLFTIAGCTWTVLNTNAWITISSPTNNAGSGTLAFSVAANPSATARSGNIQVAGQLFAVLQAGGSLNVLPRLQIASLSPQNSATVRVEGQAGKLHVLERSEDLIQWTPISTNLMPATACPNCPFVQINDAGGANLLRRFYRAIELP